MAALVLMLIALGVSVVQAVVASPTVTLRWLRLGDLIALSCLAAAGIVLAVESSRPAGAAPWALLAVGVLGYAIHLIVVQLGRRAEQRLVAVGLVAVWAAMLLWSSLGMEPFFSPTRWPMEPTGPIVRTMVGVGVILSASLLGGSLMTMMLGHAYLTAGGEMTQRPFLRLTRFLLGLLAGRAGLALLGGVVPWWGGLPEVEPIPLWTVMLVTVRLLIGLAVPAAMTWMALECVKIRSNQSATGILYVASVLTLIGELTALTLLMQTGLAF